VLYLELRLRPIAIAGGKTSVCLHRPREIADCRVRPQLGEMRKPAPAERSRIRRQELDRFRVVAHGVVDLTEPHVRASPIVVGSRIAGREHDGPVEIFERLVREAERQQQVAAIVVDGGEFRKELGREIEIFEREPRLPELDIGDATIVENGGPPVVRQRRILQRLGIVVDRLLRLSAHERCCRFVGELRRLSRCCVRRQRCRAGRNGQREYGADRTRADH